MKSIECKICVFDNTIPDISFDVNSVCSYCSEYIIKLNLMRTENRNLKKFNNLILKIKKLKGKYNCLIGVSGGVDSSYVVHLAQKNNLKPLLVHFDNGWNSELAVSNINKLIKKTGFDLNTFIVNWKEFKDLQKSLIISGVVDIEIATDHAIFANLLYTAKKNKIKYILSGTNIFTEHAMPRSWIWRKTDFKNINSIHKKFGKIKLKTYPNMNMFAWYFSKYFDFGPKTIELLNLIEYKKLSAVSLLEKEYNWVNYEDKHYESFFTKFYQSYILPTKFKIDKRIVHLSSLIRNGEISKSEALNQLSKPLYKDYQFKQDLEYFCKKLEFEKDEFLKIMSQPPVPHENFANNENIFNFFKKIYLKLYE